jgi:hypothetical protein
MMRMLTRLFHRLLADPAQLAFELDARPAPRNAAELLERLRAHGLVGIDECRLTRNRAVMISFRGRELRIHEGYLAAPDETFDAIVRFVCGRTRRERREAQQAILAFRVAHAPERLARPRRRERLHPDDEHMARTLRDWHARYNASHFGGELRAIPVGISRRMRRKLGHYHGVHPSTGEPAGIVIGRRHIRNHGWDEALHTLLHEMVHQWQDEKGLPIDHGRTFRAKAREVGITPAACREVAPRNERRPAAASERRAG